MHEEYQPLAGTPDFRRLGTTGVIVTATNLCVNDTQQLHVMRKATIAVGIARPPE